MKLGAFYFKNDDVLLLSASRADLISLADRIESVLEISDQSIPIHELCDVAPNHPGKLFASALHSPSIPIDGTWWTCNLKTVEKLRDLAESGGERYFDTYGGELFLVTSSSYYNEQWWRAHG